MKKFILYIAGCLLFTSCGIEFSDNGKLDGFWQLMSADTLINQHTLDLKTSGRTWAFQGRLLEMRDTKVVCSYVYFNFIHRGDSLLLDAPYRSERDSDDLKVTDIREVSPYGVNGLSEGFAVESLANDKMILRSKTLRLRLRKI